MSKKRANLRDQKTGLSLNPFWFTHDCPEELDALKNSYPPDDDGNILQLLHDSAIDPTQPEGAESYNVEIACCPHDMNGLLKDKATTNAYIWGGYNGQYNGTLYYNDLTNKEVGPLDITVSETVDTVDDALGFRTIRKLNFTNPNYFDLKASWKLYEWQKNISFKRKQYTVASQTDYYLGSNPVKFSCLENIKGNNTYRIYYSNLICDLKTVEIFGLNLRAEVSKDGITNWVPVKVADGSGGGADLVIWAEDNKISEGYVDVTFDDEYTYIRIKQCWDDVVIPGAPNTGTSWPTGGGGQPYPYIKTINFGLIPLVTQTPIIDNTQKLGAEETVSLKNIASEDINLNKHLELNKETSFEYRASANWKLFDFLKNTNTIINKQETKLKTTSILRVNAPIITYVSSESIAVMCIDENKPALDFLPGHELSRAILCLSKEPKPNENPLRKFILNPNQLSYTYFFDVEPNTTYYLYTIIKYSVDGNLNTTYSDVTKVKTPANNMFKIKFRSNFSNYPAWAAYEPDNTTITIARGKQLVAWTQKMPFYHPTATASRGYYVEIDTTDTLLGEVTGIDIEGTLSYNLDDKEVKCLLPNTYIIAGKDFWDKKVDGKTVYGKSFKYTYGDEDTPTTSIGNQDSYTYYYPARLNCAGQTDTIKIVVRGNSTAGNSIQYETNYVVSAPMARANRD